MTDLTRDQVVEWLRMAEAATPGPWLAMLHMPRTSLGGESKAGVPQVKAKVSGATILEGFIGDDPAAAYLAATSRTAVSALCRALLKQWNYEAEARVVRQRLSVFRDADGRVVTVFSGPSTEEWNNAYAAARTACEKAETQRDECPLCGRDDEHEHAFD